MSNILRSIIKMCQQQVESVSSSVDQLHHIKNNLIKNKLARAKRRSIKIMRPRDKGKFKASIMFPLFMYTYTHTHTYIYMISIKTLKQLNILVHSPRERNYKMYTIYATCYIGLFAKNEFKMDLSIQNGDISFRIDPQLFFLLENCLLNPLLIHDNKTISSVKC